MKRVEFAGLRLQAAAIACGVLFGSVSVLAAPPAKVPYTPPPMLTPDDPAKVAAAKEFQILYHPQTDPAYAAKMIEKIIPRVVAAEQADNPKLDVKKFEQETRAKMLATAARRLDMQALVVSHHFTLQELKDLSAFFRTPLGKKLAEETPKIMQEIMMSRRTINAGDANGGAPMKMTIDPNGKATLSPGNVPNKK